MRIEPFEIHYNQTRALWTKETSDHCMLACVQKVCFVAAAAIVAVYETLRNAGSLVRNKCMEYWCMRHVEWILCLDEQLGEDAPDSLRKLARCIKSEESIDGVITISAADFHTIRAELKKRNLTVQDIQQLAKTRG
jgi:hypothetical protein